MSELLRELVYEFLDEDTDRDFDTIEGLQPVDEEGEGNRPLHAD